MTWTKPNPKTDANVSFGVAERLYERSITAENDITGKDGSIAVGVESYDGERVVWIGAGDDAMYSLSHQQAADLMNMLGSALEVAQ